MNRTTDHVVKGDVIVGPAWHLVVLETLKDSRAVRFKTLHLETGERMTLDFLRKDVVETIR